MLFFGGGRRICRRRARINERPLPFGQPSWSRCLRSKDGNLGLPSTDTRITPGERSLRVDYRELAFVLQRSMNRGIPIHGRREDDCPGARQIHAMPRRSCQCPSRGRDIALVDRVVVLPDITANFDVMRGYARYPN